MTRRLALGGIVAALYAVLVLALSPISFGPIQFRVAEVLKPLAFYDPVCILGLSFGLVAANMASPYAGPWELIFMPMACLSGGYISWLLSKRIGWWAAGFIYALWISLAVGLMLSTVLRLPFLPTVGAVAVSEVLLIAGVGVPLIRKVASLLERWR